MGGEAKDSSRAVALRMRICKYIILHWNKVFIYTPCTKQYFLESQNVWTKRDLTDHLSPLTGEETKVQGGKRLTQDYKSIIEWLHRELMLYKEEWS